MEVRPKVLSVPQREPPICLGYIAKALHSSSGAPSLDRARICLHRICMAVGPLFLVTLSSQSHV